MASCWCEEHGSKLAKMTDLPLETELLLASEDAPEEKIISKAEGRLCTTNS